MIRFGKRKAGNGKRSRTWAKFPRGRKRVKNFNATHARMRAFYGWGECTITADHVDRFLLANIGKPVDQVFTKFLERCDSTIEDPKKIFFGEIEKKEEIIPRWGGFYVTNGILNYKKRKKPISKGEIVSHSDLNMQFMPEKSRILEICRQAKDTQKAVFLGRFYIYNGCWSHRLVSVYVIPKGLIVWPSRNVTVAGFGVGIRLYEEVWGYKPRTQMDFVRWESDFRYSTDAYEFIIREK